MSEFAVGNIVRISEYIGAYRITAVGEDSVLARHLNPDFEVETQLLKSEIELVRKS